MRGTIGATRSRRSPRSSASRWRSAAVPGWESADDWAALLAAVVIAWNGQRLLRPAIAGLMDRTEPAIREQIHGIASDVADVRAVEKVIVRRAGTNYFADLHVHADPQMSLHDAHIVSGEGQARDHDPDA